MNATSNPGAYRFVVVSNRLPVDHVIDADGSGSWARSPGGLVTALEPVMRNTSTACSDERCSSWAQRSFSAEPAIEAIGPGCQIATPFASAGSG